jgi:redox-sensitive bicupin YhaK (pirin superfamily)
MVRSPAWLTSRERCDWGGIRQGETATLIGEGDEITVLTGKKGARFLCISGPPVNEPVAWYGLIVMNTEEELRTAFTELRGSTFIREG